MRTHASRLFDELNRKYWRGRLPRYRVIQRASVPGDGRCNNARRTILLGPHPSPEDLRLTLLHEMCHIGDMCDISPRPDHDHHGPRFLRKILRLVRLGETKLLEKDIRAFEASRGSRSGSIPWRNQLRADIDSMAMDPEWQSRTWPRVARYLAERYKMTVSRLRRVAPWAQRHWREQIALVCEERRLQEQFAARFAPGA